MVFAVRPTLSPPAPLQFERAAAPCSVRDQHGAERGRPRQGSTYGPRNARGGRPLVGPPGPTAVPEAGQQCPKRAALRRARSGHRRWVRRRFPSFPQRAPPTTRRLRRGLGSATSCDTPPVAGGVPAPNQVEIEPTAYNGLLPTRPGRICRCRSPALPLVVPSAARAPPPWRAQAARAGAHPRFGGQPPRAGRRDHPALPAPGPRGLGRAGRRAHAWTEELPSATTPMSPRYPTSHGAHPIPG